MILVQCLHTLCSEKCISRKRRIIKSFSIRDAGDLVATALYLQVHYHDRLTWTKLLPVRQDS